MTINAVTLKHYNSRMICMCKIGACLHVCVCVCVSVCVCVYVGACVRIQAFIDNWQYSYVALEQSQRQK